MHIRLEALQLSLHKIIWNPKVVLSCIVIESRPRVQNSKPLPYFLEEKKKIRDCELWDLDDGVNSLHAAIYAPRSTVQIETKECQEKKME
ncbi:hypothetical protein V6N11_072748 [Hibiscus sabdariffa]|uniref:Uncharacterized protein n=2 Tax=Hibiscus sabdariffa TaxID=183260 RepID=A0ABR2C697_9ROSI